jgi:8-oxo-dGTP diphosphatase
MESSKKYPPAEQPVIAVDALLFTVDAGKLKVLLIVRDHDPFAGSRAIPGVFVHENERLEDAAARVLRDKGGITSIPYMEQLYTFGDPGRDPRGRVISVAYFSLASIENVHVTETTSRAGWIDMNDLPPLAFDHAGVLRYALQRLRWKIEYSTVAFALLPGEFTIANIQSIYEAILGRKLDSGNFWRRIIARDMLVETGRVESIPDSRRTHRPGKLYRLGREIGEIVPIF